MSRLLTREEIDLLLESPACAAAPQSKAAAGTP
jgi:hypothetical protein